MKANFKNLFLASAALLMGLTACNNGDVVDNIDTTETKTVKVNLDFGAPRSYTEGASQSTGEASHLKVKRLTLFFYTGGADNKGVVTNAFDLTTGNELDESAPGIITDYKGGNVFEVAVSATRLFVVANAPDKFDFGVDFYTGDSGPVNLASAKGQKIEDIKKASLGVETQTGYDDAKGYIVHMYDDEALSTSGTSTATVNVELQTNVARIEIGSIQAIATSNIKSFTVDGIYINGFFLSTTMSGTSTSFVKATAQTDPKEFLPSADGAVTVYTNDADEDDTNKDLNGVVYDTFSGRTAGGDPLKVAASGVWGYNLFATTTTEGFPSIVIRLSNVTIGDDLTTLSPRFITVRSVTSTTSGLSGFSEISGSSPMTYKADYLVGGCVYTLGNIEFDETNVSQVPNVSSISATVTVTVPTWKQVGVKPEL